MESQISHTEEQIIESDRIRPLLDTLRSAQTTTEERSRAFSELVRPYGAFLLKKSERWADTYTSASDIAQEALIGAWNNIRNYDPSRSVLGTWLGSIAQRRGIDALKQRTRRPRLANLNLGFLSESADMYSDPADIYEEKEGLERTMAILDQLPPEEREVLVLEVIDDKTNIQAAEHLGIPPGTLKTRAARGKVLAREIVNRVA